MLSKPLPTDPWWGDKIKGVPPLWIVLEVTIGEERGVKYLP
jgi:hypothetical protein